MREPSEAQIEAEVLAHLTFQRRHFAYKVNVAGYFDPKLQRFRPQVNPYALSGLADVYCHLRKVPHLRGVVVLFEIKSKSGSQSEAQKRFEAQIQEAEHYYFVVRSIEDVDAALRSIGAL